MEFRGIHVPPPSKRKGAVTEKMLRANKRFKLARQMSYRNSLSNITVVSRTSPTHWWTTAGICSTRWRVASFLCLLCLSPYFSSPFSLYLFGLFCVARFPCGSGGCTPRSSTASCCLQVGSVVNANPPGFSPPGHVSIRHVVLFMHLIRFFFFAFNAFFSRCFLFFFVPPRGIHLSFLLSCSFRAFASLTCLSCS